MARKGVYLIHIENGDHYLGWAEDIDARLSDHAKTICTPPLDPGTDPTWIHYGPGAHFMGVVNYKGLAWKEARVWLGKGRKFERWLKDWHGSNKFCPECMGALAYNRAKGWRGE